MAHMPKQLIRQGRLPRLLRKSEKRKEVRSNNLKRTYQKLIRKLTRSRERQADS